MNSVGLRLSSLRRPPSSLVPCWKRRRLVRAVHHLRDLPYNIEDGLGDFLPPAALKTVAVDFQRGLLERLNDEVRGTEEENKSVAQTVINTAAHRSKTLAFNYASLALNNSFFLDMLKPPSPSSSPTHEGAMSPYLGGIIRTEHGSLEQLKSNFSAAALGMASSGWVWFVTDNNGRTAVLPTFGAGTLLIRSRANLSPVRGPVLGEDVATWSTVNVTTTAATTTSQTAAASTTDPYTPGTPSEALPSSPPSGASPHTRRRFLSTSAPRSIIDLSELNAAPASLFGDSSTDPASPPVFSSSDPRSSSSSSSDQKNNEITTLGQVLYPLFCISVHEHAWMSAGFGVWGKEEWLKRFWTVLDWEKVSRSYAQIVPDKQAI